MPPSFWLLNSLTPCEILPAVADLLGGEVEGLVAGRFGLLAYRADPSRERFERARRVLHPIDPPSRFNRDPRAHAEGDDEFGAGAPADALEGIDQASRSGPHWQRRELGSSRKFEAHARESECVVDDRQPVDIRRRRRTPNPERASSQEPSRKRP
jgi:hypothetical protein